MQAITIGLDLAKHWFQVHGVDAAGKVVVRRRLRRAEVVEFFRALEPCLVGMEACATAHHWARELIGFGHEVKLMPPTYVKAYVKRNKNDATDAAAICEAVTRPSMRFVPVKTVDQQAVLMLHRARALLVRQRTMLVNALRAHMAEFGFIAPQGSAPCRRAGRGDRRERSRLAGSGAVDPARHRGAAERHRKPRSGNSTRNWPMASQQTAQPIAGDGSGRRRHGRERDRRDGDRSKPVPLRARFRGLARHDAAPEFERRQGEAGGVQQARRQIHSLVCW